MWHGHDSATTGHASARLYTIALYCAFYWPPIPGPYTLPYTAADSPRPPYPCHASTSHAPCSSSLPLPLLLSLFKRGGEEGEGQGAPPLAGDLHV